MLIMRTRTRLQVDLHVHFNLYVYACLYAHVYYDYVCFYLHLHSYCNNRYISDKLPTRYLNYIPCGSPCFLVEDAASIVVRLVPPASARWWQRGPVYLSEPAARSQRRSLL